MDCIALRHTQPSRTRSCPSLLVLDNDACLGLLALIGFFLSLDPLGAFCACSFHSATSQRARRLVWTFSRRYAILSATRPARDLSPLLFPPVWLLIHTPAHPEEEKVPCRRPLHPETARPAVRMQPVLARRSSPEGQISARRRWPIPPSRLSRRRLAATGHQLAQRIHPLPDHRDASRIVL